MQVWMCIQSANQGTCLQEYVVSELRSFREQRSIATEARAGIVLNAAHVHHCLRLMHQVISRLWSYRDKAVGAGGRLVQCPDIASLSTWHECGPTRVYSASQDGIYSPCRCKWPCGIGSKPHEATRTKPRSHEATKPRSHEATKPRSHKGHELHILWWSFCESWCRPLSCVAPIR